MNKSLLLALLFTISFLFSEDIVIVGNAYKAPKIWLENNQPKGILVDILRYTEDKLDVHYDIQLYPWMRAYTHAEHGYSGIIGLSKNPEREKKFDYSLPVYYDEVILVVKKDYEFEFNTLDDLIGKRIGIALGATFGSEFHNFKERLTLVHDNQNNSRLKMLLAGRTDVAIMGPGLSSLEHEVDLDSSLSMDKFSVLKKPLTKDPNYLAFHKSMYNTQFLEEFNKVIKEGYINGDIPEIISAYY